MSKSKKKLIAVFLILAGLAVANFVFAQVDVGLEYGAQIGLSDQDPRITIAKVIQVILGFLGIISVCLIIYAGWTWMVSEGNEEKVEKAKNILKNAVIGLIIILSAFAIVSFILNKLVAGTINGSGGGPGNGPDGPRGGIGALGACTVETVYPEPNQQEVPRNTSIIISFKEAVATSTILDGNNIKVDGRIKIYKSVSGEAGIVDFIKEVKVSTTDNKTFVLTPAVYLGSPSESIWYTVYLSNNIKKINGDGIFDTCAKDYLEWQFRVSEKLDLTSPQIKDKGVFPLPASTNPRNSVIQINFNEAVNPITISGRTDEVKNYLKIVNASSSAVASGGICVKDADCVSFKCQSGVCEGENNYLEGRFVVSNQYRTVEFVSNNQCGVNGCGEKIYCLPGGSQIKVELRAAALADCGADNCASRNPFANCTGGHCQDSNNKNYPLSILPFTGVVDVAANSLDGNRDDDADGPVSIYNENSPNPANGDNYQWSFSVSDEIDLSSPVIKSIFPIRGASGVNLTEPIVVTFNKLMMSSSLKSGSLMVNNGVEDIEHKLINLISTTSPGYWVASENIPEAAPTMTQAEIRHSLFGDSATYRAQVGSGVKDINQNCFKPSSGPGCTANSEFPSCCVGATEPTVSCP